MSAELMQLLCGVLLLYGAALCFFGYRVFRACLAAAGLAVGLFVGLVLARELSLQGLARWLIVAGVGLLGAVLAAAIYFVGVFVVGGLGLAGTAALVATRLSEPLPAPVLAGIGAAGGVLALLWHRKLVVYATALVGALIVVAGLAPLVNHAHPPEAFTLAWLGQQVDRLPAWWLAGALGLAVAGGLAQQWGHHRRYGLVFGSATAASATPGGSSRVDGGEEVARRSRARRSGDSGRTHGAICPRCGSIVDVDALLCHQCGNDRWD
jgi:hypothetical protein